MGQTILPYDKNLSEIQRKKRALEGTILRILVRTRSFKWYCILIFICREFFKVEKWNIWTICAFDRNLSNFSKRICGPSCIVPDWTLSNILKEKAFLMETYWESFKGQCGSNHISHTWSWVYLKFVKKGTNGNTWVNLYFSWLLFLRFKVEKKAFDRNLDKVLEKTIWLILYILT